MDMTDEQVNALMDELQAAQKRANAAEERCKHLVEAIDWFSIGVNPLTSDQFIGGAESSSLLRDDGPITAKDAAIVSALHAIRHGAMIAYAALRDDAPERLEETARDLAAGTLSIHDHDLVEQSMMQMLNLAFYMKERGVEGAAHDAVARFSL